jgi:hypothetical protein
MKKSFNCLFAGLLVGATVSMSTLANASETNAYIGINYNLLTHDSPFVAGEEFDTGETLIRFGGEINNTFSSELRIGGTTNRIEDNASGAEFRHVYSVGGLLRVRKELGPITPYLGVGYMWTKEELSGAGAASYEGTMSDVADAAGVDISLGEKLGLNIEYFALTLEQFADNNRSGPSAGLFWRF